jgi:hypothetical protein
MKQVNECVNRNRDGENAKFGIPVTFTIFVEVSSVAENVMIPLL